MLSLTSSAKDDDDDRVFKNQKCLRQIVLKNIFSLTSMNKLQLSIDGSEECEAYLKV